MARSVPSFPESRASRCLRLLSLFVCLASCATGALAQVVLSPSRIEWPASSTVDEAVHVDVTGPWTAEIYPQGHFVVDSEEGEDSDFIHVSPEGPVSGSSDIYATLTVRDSGGRFAEVQLLHRAPRPPDPPAPQDSTERIDLGGNWILHRTYTSGDGSSSYEDLTFYDGLGYAVQTVKVGASPDGGLNIVTPTVYDALRRSDARTYLPYVSSSGGRAAVPSSDVLAEQSAWYGSRFPDDGAYAYGEKVYESSPLDRASAFHRAGADYARGSGNRGVAVSRSLCAADEVLLLLVGSSGELTVSGHYPAGSLMRTRTTDEDGSVSVVWTDSFGRALLERRLCGEQALDTYHVYDALGRETWTVSPEGSAALPSSGSWTAPQPGDANGSPASRYCTVRTCDAAGNVLSRKLPGRETEEYVYDASGRLRMRRDGLARKAGKWFTYTYDHGGRLTETRLLPSSGSAEHFRQLFASGASSPAEVYPAGAVLLVRRDYGSYASAGADLGFVPVPGVAESADLARTAGLLTYEKVAELGSGGYGSVSGHVERAHYYDGSGREVQTVEKDASGAVSRHSFRLDFSGNVTEEVEEHLGTSKRTSVSYDARGRRLSETVRLNAGAEALVTYAYDGLGRQVGMTMGGAQSSSSGPSVVQTDSYDILVRMSSRTVSLGPSPLFSMSLRYGAPLMGTSPRWSGGISEWEWRHGSGTAYTYAFGYDGAGRLTDSGRYAGAGTPALNSRSERGMSYDRNGNLKTLLRYGGSGDTPELSLSYSYEGNRRAGLAYDADGNLETLPDGSSVEYNLLDQPSSVREGGAVRSRHTYLADGTRVSSADASAGERRYRGSFVYGPDGSLESVGFSAGRIHGGGTSPEDVRYHVLDHLGSVRAVVDGAGTVRERSDYYPYGERYGVAAASTADRWRFSGKEDLSSVGGIPALDFGARLYSPGSVTWLTQDPAAESYPWLSPYSYCAGDPLRFVDSSGEFIETVWDALNVSIGIASLSSNIREGNFLGAALDAAALAYDLFATATPFVPGGASTALKAVRAGGKAAGSAVTASAGRAAVSSAESAAAGQTVRATVKSTAVSAARGFRLGDRLAYYGEFGIDSYDALRKAVVSRYGTGSGLQVHHIVEQRFAKYLGIENTGKMPAIVLTKEEHRAFTNAWRKAIPYISDYSSVDIDDVRRAAAEVYADLPEMMGYVEQTLRMATIH